MTCVDAVRIERQHATSASQCRHWTTAAPSIPLPLRLFGPAWKGLH